MIKDGTGSITSYDVKKMGVGKFVNDHILKSTETAKVSKNDDVAIFATDVELSAFSYEKAVTAKVVSIDLKKLMQTYLCPVCSTPVSINNAVAWCEKCDNASSQSQCRSKADVKMIILDESGQLRSTIDVPNPLIEKSINLIVSKTPRKDIVMKRIKKSFSFTLNKVCICATEKVLFRDRLPSNLSNIN